LDEAADPDPAFKNKRNPFQIVKRITTTGFIVLSAVFFVLLDNFAFFRDVIEVYPVSWDNIGLLTSLTLVLTGVMAILYIDPIV